MTLQVNVAVFGAGRAGRIHIANVTSHRQFQLKYLVDIDIKHLEATKEEFQLHETQLVLNSDSDVVFNDTSIHGIIVASTTHTHEEIVTRALKKHIPVFCEKPVAESLESLTTCYRLAQENNTILHCSFNRRFDPSIMELKRRYPDEVGETYVMKTVSRDSPCPSIEYLKVSNGIFHDCAVHDLDMICWMLGEWPTSVFAMASAFDPKIRAIDDFDTISISMKFASGTVAHIDLRRSSPVGYDQRLEVVGSKGMMKIENHPKDRVAVFNEKGCQRSPIDYSFPQRYKESYVNSLDHFLNLIRGTESYIVKPLECINVSKLATICEESCRLGQARSFEPAVTL